MSKTAKLGPSDLEVGAQGLGCQNLTGCYGRQFDEDSAIATLNRALDLGVTLLDTADSYGPSEGITNQYAHFGGNEEFVGRAISHRRDEVVLASKFGYVDTAKVSNGRHVRADREYVREACTDSLRRLGVEHIDLYICHRLDPTVEVEETVSAMAELIQEGKVRYIGLSAVSADSLRRAAAVHPITALESEWSLWTRDIEYGMVETARDLNVGIMPYAPLGRGFLTGHLRRFEDLSPGDPRRRSPRFQGENFARNLELVDVVKSLADDKGCTASQLALAWLHEQGDFVVPIPGADRPEFVEENLGALDVRLTDADLAMIDATFPLNVAAGARYADMSSVSDAAPTDATLKGK
ncbi:aldo/keto reductase [Nocardia sp. NPDC059239]|uniref:aldo/keto reductase n=1 Tax=Nocardia sp. NPDC059239 TaxID=3346785 RepID=UPI0036C8CBC3